MMNMIYFNKKLKYKIWDYFYYIPMAFIMNCLTSSLHIHYKKEVKLIEDAKPKPTSRSILSPTYIRKLIDENYKITTNYDNYVSLEGIAVRLQIKYSLKINTEMVLQAMMLDPAYKITYYYSTAGCRFIRYNY